MATGVPIPKQRNCSNSGSEAAIDLSYPGKKSKAEILSHRGAAVHCAWGQPGTANRLYFAENSGILAMLASDKEVCGKIRLIYIDPPFATQTAFHSRKLISAYDDLLTGNDYLEFLRERLILMYRLLANDGSLYLHLDAKMVFPVKIIMDEVFGASGFRNCIVRKKCNPKNYTRKQYGNVCDFILFYSKGSEWIWNRPIEPWAPERTKEYQYVEPETGRRYMKVPVHAPQIRRGETGQPWRGRLPPPGKHWQYPPRVLDEMDARGEIYWSPNGNPRRKVYLDQSPGVGVQDLWLDFRDAHNQNIRITGYPTEKNVDILRRIIFSSSNPGDLVLDCFVGAGTTLVAASELDRRWIGIDNSAEALRATLRRFAVGTEPMGDFVGRKGRNSSAREHSPITDFSLWVEVDLRDVADPSIRDWNRKMESTSAPAEEHPEAIRDLFESTPTST